jgi:hypothetical protein
MAWLLIIIINNIPTTIPFADKPACQQAAESIKSKFKEQYTNHICISSSYSGSIR